jgi:hypothetical protein
VAERSVVAVLGYSTRRRRGLHPVCERRLRHAEGEAEAASAVVLSGWARHRDGSGEAELMRDAWAGPDVPLVCDVTASSTVENAAAIARAARALDAARVVVVTSSWHRRRATSLVEAALAGSGIAVVGSASRGSREPFLRARELACLLALPVQRRRLARTLARAEEAQVAARSASGSGRTTASPGIQ